MLELEIRFTHTQLSLSLSAHNFNILFPSLFSLWTPNAPVISVFILFPTHLHLLSQVSRHPHPLVSISPHIPTLTPNFLHSWGLSPFRWTLWFLFSDRLHSWLPGLSALCYLEYSEVSETPSTHSLSLPLLLFPLSLVPLLFFFLLLFPIGSGGVSSPLCIRT